MPNAPFSLYQKRGRWYGDFRKLGGGQVALKAEGAKAATPDKKVAHRLALALASRLQSDANDAARLGFNPALALRTYGFQVLATMERRGEVSPGWSKVGRDYLSNALLFFETVQPQTAADREDRRRMAAPRNMLSVSAPDVVALQDWLRVQPNGRGGTYSDQTVRHHCSVLSRIYRTAMREGQVRENPVAAAGLPPVPETETVLLEAEEVALALEAARLVAEDAAPGERARALVFVYLAGLAYTGCRSDELERVDWTDLLESVEGHVLRVHSAQKGRASRRRGRVRLVPVSSHFAAILSDWRRRSGRLAGPIMADPDTGRLPDMRKALAAVERRAGLPAGVLGSRTTRTAYATHRATCDGVTWNDVREELGHATLDLQARVYGRGRMNREPMGAELDYRFARWSGALAGRLAAATPTRGEVERAERERVIRAFLSAVAGLGIAAAAAETGVDKAVVQRLRSGTATDARAATVAKMRAYLARRAAA